MKTALVIMAAGIGSRFGGGIKQLEPVGRHGEIIMDYSIHDAIEAGFNKLVFIIRRDIKDAFGEAIGSRIEELCRKLNVEIAYAFQELDNIPQGAALPEGRTKPWGTGQAVLACKGIVKEPFAVINADDYYGKAAFKSIHSFLEGYTPQRGNDFCMAGFVLKNTLSENGGVTRGICSVDESGCLKEIKETPNIVKTASGASCDSGEVDISSLVSMNMWGLTPEFIASLEDGFKEFFNGIEGRELKAEFLLPIYIDSLLKAGRASVKVLNTDDRWFGVTYKEDKDMVVSSFEQLIQSGVYRDELFADLFEK